MKTNITKLKHHSLMKKYINLQNNRTVGSFTATPKTLLCRLESPRMVEHFQPPQPTATCILQDMTPDGVVLCLGVSSTKAADSITQHRKAANSWCDAGRGARSPYPCRQARTICLLAVPPSVVASRINNVFHNFIVEEWCFSLVRLVFLQWTWINGK